METVQHSPTRLALIYGALIGMVSIVLTMIFYMTQWSQDLWTGFLVSGIIFIGVLLAVIHGNSAMGGSASLSRLFLLGLVVTVIATIMVTTASIIFHLATEPPAEVGGNIPSDGPRMSEYSEYKRGGFWITLLTNVLFAHLTLGVLGAVIGAITVKRNQKTPDAR
ncbi:hypothetical protein ACWKWU_07500 [Chitinophaga lutea]